MEIRIQIQIECGGQCERSPDELYVTAGSARRGSAGLIRCIGEGKAVAGQAISQSTGMMEAWRGELQHRQTVAILINLNEQDGADTHPGERLTEQMVRRMAGCLTEAEGDGIRELEALTFEPLLQRAERVVGCLHGDCLIGSFMVILNRTDEGKVQGHVHPVAYTSVTMERRLLSTGAGGAYLTTVCVNNHQIGSR